MYYYCMPVITPTIKACRTQLNTGQKHSYSTYATCHANMIYNYISHPIYIKQYLFSFGFFFIYLFLPLFITELTYIYFVRVRMGLYNKTMFTAIDRLNEGYKSIIQNKQYIEKGK